MGYGVWGQVMKSFRDLETWQVSMKLAEAVYKETQCMPKAELYAMTSQIRRAAVSIPANIAEGYGRNHRAEYVQFLGIANGSLCELQTILILAESIGYLSISAETSALLASTGKLLYSLTASLKPLRGTSIPSPQLP